MICIENFGERVVFVGHKPLLVYAATREDSQHVKSPKNDGHYDKADLDRLVSEGHATLYEERAIMDILLALPNLIGGCPPRI